MTHNHSDSYERILQEAGIRATAMRLMVLKTIHEQVRGAFSLQDISNLLPTADNSSVFRALTLFSENQILHLIDDGSGMQKYCLCHCQDHHHHHGHVHMTCTVCHETICLEDVPIPDVPVPQGYDVIESEYVIKGICPKCRKA